MHQSQRAPIRLGQGERLCSVWAATHTNSYLTKNAGCASVKHTVSDLQLVV